MCPTGCGWPVRGVFFHSLSVHPIPWCMSWMSIFMGSIVVSVVRSASRRWRDLANGSLTSDHDPTRTSSGLIALFGFASCVFD